MHLDDVDVRGRDPGEFVSPPEARLTGESAFGSPLTRLLAATRTERRPSRRANSSETSTSGGGAVADRGAHGEAQRIGRSSDRP